jgi:ankyrin repeat protein
MDNIDDVDKFFESDDWYKLMKNIEKLKGTTNNGNNLMHMACIRGRKDIIEEIISKYPELVYIANKEGDTCAHILIKNGYFEILKEIVSKYPDIITFTNDKGENILQAAIDQPMILAWLIDTMPKKYKDSYNNLTFEGWTLLLKMLQHTTMQDVYIGMITKMLDQGININYPISNPPLIYSAMNNNVVGMKLLLDHGANPDIRDDNHITALMRTIMNDNYETTKLLIEHKSDINYGGPENNNLPLNLAIIKHNDRIVELLINEGSNMIMKDQLLNTPIHYLLQTNRSDKWIKSSVIFKALYNGDLNSRNINGVTPLHMLTKYKMWENYTEILKMKDLGINIKDKINNTPISYLDNYELNKLLNITAESKIKNIKCKEYEKNKCMRYIKTKLMENKKINQKKIEYITKVTMPTIIKTSYGLFNSDMVHNCIYTIIMLKKYKNLMIPYQYNNEDKQMNELYELDVMNNYRDLKGEILVDLLKRYTELCYQLVPHLIIWANENVYYSKKDLKINIINIMKKDNIRFVLFKLTLIPSMNSTHANIVIYDKKTKDLIRFEPYGYLNMEDSNILDEYLSDIFKQVLGEDINIILPKTYMTNSRFQSISNDTDISNKKLGDPQGYCLAWAYWFLELKLSNPDVEIKELLDNSFDNILTTETEEGNQFMGYIRKYAFKLDKLKNNFLIKAGIKKQDLYNLVYTNDKFEKIINYIKDEFEKIVAKRIDN